MNFEDETSLDADSFTEEEEITAVFDSAVEPCVIDDIRLEPDLDTKILIAKLQDMSRDVKGLEDQFTPVLEVIEEESEVEIEPQVEEEEEELSEDESILRKMESDSLSRLVLDKIEEMDITDSNTSALDRSMIVGDVDGETEIGCEKMLQSQIDYVFRDVDSAHETLQLDGVHDLFKDVNDDYCIDCLFEESSPDEITRTENIDDNSWCEAKCFIEAAEEDSGYVDPELFELIGSGDIDVIEFTTYVDVVCQ